MQNYINQLIADLEEVALTPYKTIEEWTGIKQEVFPDITQLHGEQWDLDQMLYVLFAKSHQEQMEIFSTLQAYMIPSEEEEDIQ